MLSWANRFNICCFLDNHQYTFSSGSIECLLAAGSKKSLSLNAGNALQCFQEFYDDAQDWVFGHLGYDLKNEIEDLVSTHRDGLHFPDLYFFIPEIIVKLTTTELIVGAEGNTHETIFSEITRMDVSSVDSTPGPVAISNRYTKEEYIAVIEQLQQHLSKGDCYEINFCQEFYAENAVIDPLQIYRLLSASSPNPFSAFYKTDDKYLLCLSPERYLKKVGRRILSQPIKGTLKRTKEQDQNSITQLMGNAKERAENIMIVDLVRNDLSRICRKGSVKVDELCAVYAFPQVYQMISTISGELREEVTVSEAIRASFPMGSMTGAPKKKVMQLIEHYERTRRGLFSGSIGYFTPEGDFDLNVVIRSVLYNDTENYLSFQTGSAITFASNPEEEYAECLLKAAVIKNALLAI